MTMFNGDNLKHIKTSSVFHAGYQGDFLTLLGHNTHS